uniref:ecotin family protein n=1 Tax=Enterobacter hormaechei TaxID=158836 RepID=UPI0023EE9850
MKGISKSSAFASETPKEQPLEKVAPYPQADKGMKRQVIQLPAQQNEGNFKVERFRQRNPKR